ncbi:hypothetical protein E5S67_01732 [Microcoleus sp. IPMA8]|uniref:Uncharacterized protein n=1 Tax=Microcoleus asticus IPMA8 TaxID=2563858 RepID=A0ABX2CUJ4_9CYAN|nr:hypothetical protein [Microcoleus asticus IPMA8]
MLAFPKSSAFYHTFVYLQNRDAPEGKRVQFGVEGWNVAKKRGRGGEREKGRKGEIFTLFLQGLKYII